jgi:hypothetical protein
MYISDISSSTNNKIKLFFPQSYIACISKIRYDLFLAFNQYVLGFLWIALHLNLSLQFLRPGSTWNVKKFRIIELKIGTKKEFIAFDVMQVDSYLFKVVCLLYGNIGCGVSSPEIKKNLNFGYT